MSGLSSRFKRLKENLRSSKTSKRLAALRECSDLLLVSNEDTLGASFSTSAFATEFIAILSGKPNIDSQQRDGDEQMGESDEMDEDAQLAAALAMSAGDAFPEGDQEDMECQLLACRCLAHLMEALPGSGHTLVHLGAVPVLCSKLNEISYIELAEQTLSVSVSQLVTMLTLRQWRRFQPNIRPQSFARAVWLRCSTSCPSSPPMYNAPRSRRPPIAVVTSLASTLP